MSETPETAPADANVAPAVLTPASDVPASEPVVTDSAPTSSGSADTPVAPDAPASPTVDAPAQSRNASGQFVSASSPDAVAAAPADVPAGAVEPAPSPAPDAPPADSAPAPADGAPAAPATQFNSTPDVAPDPLAAELAQLKAQFAALQQERDAARAAYISLANGNQGQEHVDALAENTRLNSENARLRAELSASSVGPAMTPFETRLLAAVEQLAGTAPKPAEPAPAA